MLGSKREGLRVAIPTPVLVSAFSDVGNCAAVSVFSAVLIDFGISFGAIKLMPTVATAFAAEPKKLPMLPKRPIAI